MTALRALLTAALLLTGSAFAQYNSSAGVNAPSVRALEDRVDAKTGRVDKVEVIHAAQKDGYGNARGNQYDLAVDGAFAGQTVLVLQFYDFSFDATKQALAEKGFSVVRYSGAAPSPTKLAADLEKSCQLWIIGGDHQALGPEHLAVIKRFFDAGHGLYLWGDNEPYYVDTNAVSQALLGTTMTGNLIGSQTVGLQGDDPKKPNVGVKRGHLLTTGLEFLFEGITIATIAPTADLQPILYGSANNLVTAVYEKNGKRAVLDGGFTRLYNNWDSAGTGRYVKNAAAWLVNAERFPQAVAKKVATVETK